jgi:hypothetical protein
MINKDEIAGLLQDMSDNLLQMDSHRESNNEIVKVIKAKTGFKPTAIRAAASALHKRNRDELDEKQAEIFTILDMVDHGSRQNARDV